MVAMLKMPSEDTYRLPGGNINTSPQNTGAERRMFPRKEFSATVEGKRMDHSLPALRDPHLRLALRDLSLGGLSAISAMPLEQGERLTVTFPPQGLNGAMRAGWDAVGRVLRCSPSALGY